MDPLPAGYDVRPVESLRAANDYLAANSADIVLLDLGKEVGHHGTDVVELQQEPVVALRAVDEVVLAAEAGGHQRVAHLDLLRRRIQRVAADRHRPGRG